jgi:hypothetical protein
VTRNGDVYRINPDKLGDASRYLTGSDLPGVVEARSRLEIEREQTAELWADLRDGHAQAALDREGDWALHRHVYAAEHGVESTLHAADDAVGAGFKAANGFASGFAKTVEKVFDGLFSFFGLGEPKLTPQQTHDRARALGNEETLHANAYAAEQQQKERDTDDRLSEQQRSRDIARTQGIETTGDPEEDRFRSIMQRAARDRDRDREYERER